MEMKIIKGSENLSGYKKWEQLINTKDIYQYFDKSFISLIKALEHNLNFELLIKDIRTKLNIPIDGYSFEDYKRIKGIKNKDENIKDITDGQDSLQSYLKLDENQMFIEISRIIRLYKIDVRIEDQLQHIILANCIFPRTKIAMEQLNWNDLESNPLFTSKEMKMKINRSVNIEIFEPISKNELILYIENNWDLIKNEINHLIHTEDIFVSDRDLRIYELRMNEKVKFKDITDKIIKEFNLNNLDGSLNEDSIKAAFFRAKSIIEKLCIKVSNK